MSVSIKQEPIDLSEVNIHCIPSTPRIKPDPDRLVPKVLVENCECCGTDIPPVLSTCTKKIKSETSSLQKPVLEDLKYPNVARIKVTAPSPSLPCFDRTDYHHNSQYWNRKPWHVDKWRRPRNRNNFHKSTNFLYRKNFSRDFESSRKYHLNRSRLYNVPLKHEKKEVILLKIKSTDKVREVFFDSPAPLFMSAANVTSKETLNTTNNKTTDTLHITNNNTLSNNTFLKPSTKAIESDKEYMDIEPGSTISINQSTANKTSEINVNNENYLVIDEFKDSTNSNMDINSGMLEGEGNADPVEIQDTVVEGTRSEVNVIDHENKFNELSNSPSNTFVQFEDNELEIISEMPKDEEIICMDRKNEVNLCTQCFVKGRKEKREDNDIVFVGTHNKRICLNRTMPIVSIEEMEEIL